MEYHPSVQVRGMMLGTWWSTVVHTPGHFGERPVYGEASIHRKSTVLYTGIRSGPGSNGRDQGGNLVVDVSAFRHQLTDFVHRMDDRRMVPAAELPSDYGIAQVGQLAKHVHGHLSGCHQRSPTAWTGELLTGEPVDVSGPGQDQVWCDDQR